MLVSRLGAFVSCRFARPPPPVSVAGPVLSVSSAPEGDVHQSLAAGGQLGVGGPAGGGGTGFRPEAEEAEEEGDGHLSVSGGVRHLDGSRGGTFREDAV